MSPLLILFASVAVLFLLSTIWCCLAISSAAEIEYRPPPKPIGDSWCLHRNGEFFVVVAYIRGHTFAWSYLIGQELVVMNTIWHHYQLGLLTRDEAAAIGEMVAGSSLTKVSV